jgi:IPT/TIG domain
VAVQYGPKFWKFTGTGCSVSVASTQITCTSVPGYGATFVWQVTVGGTTANAVPFASLGYTVPAVTGLSLTTGANPNGGETVTITGSNFGATDIEIDQFGNSRPIMSVTYSNGGGPLTPTGCHTV